MIEKIRKSSIPDGKETFHLLEEHADKQNNTLFALDIGTRSVVGLIVEPLEERDKFQIKDCYILEHKERSMLDGQIHDVLAVAEIIEKIKQHLSEKHGPLQEVAVAAAGRSLKTKRVRFELPISHLPVLTKDDVLTLEFSAVQKAQAELAQELNELDITRYYCVGYSVVNYYLDEEIIGSLIDQRGTNASVDVIATFLPRMVVDSLLAALKRSGLEMKALTLEPIAAIHVLIPTTMRRLNIALVDIGAGTSDIALTEDGSITAYGMVPTAGDEITDALMNAYLLDFPVAEEVKRQLHDQETVQFHDILGIEQELATDQVIAAIDSEIESLAEQIAHKILELNGKAPQAVMLIGGGSLTPTLPTKVAQHLGLPANRVAVRGADAIKQFVGEHPLLNGPAFVTPVGIALAAHSQPIRYVTVTINDSPVRLFDLRKMTLGDALLAAGMDIKRLHGRPGLAMSVNVNGRLKIIPGGHGTSPTILINGRTGSLDSLISDGDIIRVSPGEDGMEATALAQDLIDSSQVLPLTINGEEFVQPPIVLHESIILKSDALLSDRMDLEMRLPKTVGEAIQSSRFATLIQEVAEAPLFTVTCNNQTYSLPRKELHILLNGKKATLLDLVYSQDTIHCEVHDLETPTIGDLITPEDMVQETVNVYVNDQLISLETGHMDIQLNGNPATIETQLQHNDVVTIRSAVGEAPMVSDIFRYIEIPAQPIGTNQLPNFIMKVNNVVASFQTPLVSGDKVELYWE